MRFNSNLGSGMQGKHVDVHERKRWTDLENTLNNNIEFGSTTSQGNIKGTWITVKTPTTPNTDFTVAHNLGVAPAGYDVKQKDAACDVYTGSVPPTSNNLTLRSTVGGVNLTLFVH